MSYSKIPKTFMLGAITWKIWIDDTEPARHDAYGLSVFTEKRIVLAKNNSGRMITLDSMEQTLYHEITHAILDTLGEHELSNNEEFVQKFSLLLHQFEKTKE